MFRNIFLKCKKKFPVRYHVGLVGKKPKHPRDSYGAWLYHLRKEKGMTQQALADATGIHQRMISYWERTGRLAGRKQIFALAKAFKVSVSELLREKH